MLLKVYIPLKTQEIFEEDFFSNLKRLKHFKFKKINRTP